MERISRLIGKLPLSGEMISPEDVACAAWPMAVGRKIARHARAARMVRTHLIVEVEDAMWQKQLFALTAQVLKSLEKQIGAGLVEDIEFRVVPRRLGPQRATQSAPGLFDEADGIADPILRRIYRSDRKKAQR